MARKRAEFRSGAEGGADTALFARYPALADRLPWRPLGAFPTPVEELPAPAEGVRLFAKRDDLSSPLYGGNKVRKLEHLLADARRRGRGTLVTIGAIGSNHALATALHGRAAGFEVELCICDQPVTENVRRNLGGFLHAGARLHYRRNLADAFLGARRAFTAARRRGGEPYFIMPGGTSLLGNAGYVNAAFELAAQVRAGVLPEPDRVFVALGSCGTAAGLVAGLKLAGLRSRVAAVRVTSRLAANALSVGVHARRAAAHLRRLDAEVPAVRIGRGDFDVIGDQLGGGYGVPTLAAEAALQAAAPRLRLETTYSAKAFAACLAYCRAAPPGTVVLFFNTYNSAPVACAPPTDGLPDALRRVLEGGG